MGHTDTVRELVRLGAQVNAKNKVRPLPVIALAFIAARRVGLQNAFCDTTLMHAVSCGKTATAAELVRLGANVNAKNSVRMRPHAVQLRALARGPRRLQCVVYMHTDRVFGVLRQGRLVLVRAPLTAGFDAWLQNGSTALMNAASTFHTATAVELVHLGADINAKDNVCIRCRCARAPRRLSVSSVWFVWRTRVTDRFDARAAAWPDGAHGSCSLRAHSHHRRAREAWRGYQRDNMGVFVVANKLRVRGRAGAAV
jgi:hypothetical protein